MEIVLCSLSDLVEDIRDILRSKQLEVKSKFRKQEPMTVLPMAALDDEKSHSVESECEEKVREPDER